MWISRFRYEELQRRLLRAEHQSALSDSAFAALRRSHTQTVRELLRRLRIAEKREASITQTLELERHENRKAERFWANAILKAKQSMPMQEKDQPPLQPAPRKPEDFIDLGELEALMEISPLYGVPSEEARLNYFREKGVAVKE